MPASRQRWRSPSIALAVSATIAVRRAPLCFALADQRRGLVAVAFGHLAVHQHDVVRQSAERLDGLEAVADRIDAMSELVEHPHRDTLVDGVVLGQQDAHASHGVAAAPEQRRASGGRPVPPGTLCNASACVKACSEIALLHRLGDQASEPSRCGLVQPSGQHDRRGQEQRQVAVVGRPRIRSPSVKPSMPGIC